MEVIGKEGGNKIMKNHDKIIALDFDGTVVPNEYPAIGYPIKGTIKRIKEEIANGARIILWTNRSGKLLEAAVRFCEEQGIVLTAVNENLPEIVAAFGNNPRKIFAHEYWDDRAVHISEEE